MGLADASPNILIIHFQPISHSLASFHQVDVLLVLVQRVPLAVPSSARVLSTSASTMRSTSRRVSAFISYRFIILITSLSFRCTYYTRDSANCQVKSSLTPRPSCSRSLLSPSFPLLLYIL